jgi:hypothetical protein
MMTKRQTVAYFLVAFVMLLIATMSCVSTQPPSQERQLQATISALETQVTLRQQLGEPTATPVTQQSQEQQLQATIAALQTQVAQMTVQLPSSPSTATPIPTPILFPDTPPDSILEVEQAWKKGGLELRLTEASLELLDGRPVIAFALELTNKKLSEIAIEYNLQQNVKATDNLGRNLEIAPLGFPGFVTFTKILRSGDTIRLVPNGGWCGECDYLAVFVEAANPAITEVIVSVSVADITNARWRVPIQH